MPTVWCIAVRWAGGHRPWAAVADARQLGSTPEPNRVTAEPYGRRGALAAGFSPRRRCRRRLAGQLECTMRASGPSMVAPSSSSATLSSAVLGEQFHRLRLLLVEDAEDRVDHLGGVVATRVLGPRSSPGTPAAGCARPSGPACRSCPTAPCGGQWRWAQVAGAPELRWPAIFSATRPPMARR